MGPAEQHWLTLILVTWTVPMLVVLAVMLTAVIRYRSQPRANSIFRAGTAVQAAWMVVPITIVVLIVVLAVRVHDAGGDSSEVDQAVKAAASTEAPLAHKRE